MAWCRRLAQMPKFQKLAILMVIDRQTDRWIKLKSIILPFAHAHGVITLYLYNMHVYAPERHKHGGSRWGSCALPVKYTIGSLHSK